MVKLEKIWNCLEKNWKKWIISSLELLISWINKMFDARDLFISNTCLRKLLFSDFSFSLLISFFNLFNMVSNFFKIASNFLKIISNFFKIVNTILLQGPLTGPKYVLDPSLVFSKCLYKVPVSTPACLHVKHETRNFSYLLQSWRFLMNDCSDYKSFWLIFLAAQFWMKICLHEKHIN